MSFSERLEVVLGDRKPTPWGEALGFNKATTSRLTDGHTPGAEILNAISLTENVSLSWLVSGLGQPYVVNSFDTAAGICDAYREKVGNFCDVFIAPSATGVTVVIVREDEYDYKGTPIDFQRVEVLTVSAPKELYNLLRKHHSQGQAMFALYVSEDEAIQLASGQIGTYQLMKKIIPKYSTRLDDFDDDWIKRVFFGDDEPNTLNERLIRSTLKIIDRVQAEEDLAMNNDQKAGLVSTIYQQLEGLNP